MASLVGYLFMGRNFFGLFWQDSMYMGFPPIIIGIFSALIAGAYFDRKKIAESFLKSALVLPASIFLFASLVGCFANFIINGQFQDLLTWFFKPIFWLVIVGLPSSLAFGAFYFVFSKKLNRP